MKAAVVGAGRMGRRHLAILKALDLEIVGVLDQHTDSLQVASRELQLSQECLYSEAEPFFRCQPECVIVATTAPSHAEFVCRAAQAGARHILCEKPLAVSLRQCDRMMETCAENGADLAVNHQMRFMQQYQIPKRLAESPAFGGLCSVNVITGNFGLAMNGTHYFEMFRYLSNDLPRQVSGWFSPEILANPRGPQFEDRAGCVRVTSGNGKRFYMDCSADQGQGMQVMYGCRNGQITVDELRGDLTCHVRQDEHRDQPTTRYAMPFNTQQQTIQPADVLGPTQAVLQSLLNQDNYPTAQHGRMAVATLVAATISAEQDSRPVLLEQTEDYVDREFPWA